MLPKKVISEMKRGDEMRMFTYHFTLGLWMRNNWGLWGGSRLKEYMNGLGFVHPDDMSGFILQTFWRYLHGLPLGIENEATKQRMMWHGTQRTNGNTTNPK